MALWSRDRKQSGKATSVGVSICFDDPRPPQLREKSNPTARRPLHLGDSSPSKPSSLLIQTVPPSPTLAISTITVPPPHPRSLPRPRPRQAWPTTEPCAALPLRSFRSHAAATTTTMTMTPPSRHSLPNLDHEGRMRHHIQRLLAPLMWPCSGQAKRSRQRPRATTLRE